MRDGLLLAVLSTEDFSGEQRIFLVNREFFWRTGDLLRAGEDFLGGAVLSTENFSGEQKNSLQNCRLAC